jgi:hypothetical protein
LSEVTDVPPATNALVVSAPVAGLLPGMLYYYCVVASNAAGTAISQHATFSTDAPPPSALTLNASGVTSEAAVLNGSVNSQGAPAICYFQYGLTTDYGMFSATNALPADTTTVPVATPVAGLAPGVVYHYAIVAANAGGTTVGQDVTFSTSYSPPSATTLAASDVTADSAVLNAKVDSQGLGTTCFFEYGVANTYGSVSPPIFLPGVTSAMAAAVAAPLTGLAPATLFHYRIVATNGVGKSIGQDATFTTSVAPPLAATRGALDVTTDSALLNAVVNPLGAATTCFFQYGLTTNYGSLSAIERLAAGVTCVVLEMPVAGLSPGTVYHYCIVATNVAGTTLGEDATFTTPLPAPVRLAAALAGPGADMQLSFDSDAGASFTVLSATNTALPASQWTVVGAMTETSPGHYQFTASGSSKEPQRYYRIRSP